uniref:Uncharacterized protein n=1 Tax=Aegilops tauschii subsp. strangulata TaxID=200361 RepID=A0A453CWA2_AEGTS
EYFALPHDSVFALVTWCRSETTTISTAGHANDTSVHCAGRSSSRRRSILAPGDASNIPQTTDAGSPISPASVQAQFPKLPCMCIHTRPKVHLPWRRTWFQLSYIRVLAQLFIVFMNINLRL